MQPSYFIIKKLTKLICSFNVSSYTDTPAAADGKVKQYINKLDNSSTDAENDRRITNPVIRYTRGL